jgi:hypothetical protein
VRRPQLRDKRGAIDNPGKVGRLDSMIDHGPGDAKASGLNEKRPGAFCLGMSFQQEFRNDFIKGGKFAALISLVNDFSVGIAVEFEQSKIALGTPNVSGQDHVLLPDRPRVAPAGFP